MSDEVTEQSQVEEIEKAILEMDGEQEDKSNEQRTTESETKETHPKPDPGEEGKEQSSTDKSETGTEEDKSEKKSGEEGTEEEIIDDVPETADPNKENFKKLREGRKRDKQKLREMQDKLKELEKSQSTTPVDKVPNPVLDNEPSNKEPDLELSQVLDYYGKGINGDLGERSQEYVELAKQALNKFSPQEIAQALKKSSGGGFGEHSEDITEILRVQLPIANATYMDQVNIQKEQQTAIQQRESSNKLVLEKYPDIQDKTSEFSKKYFEVIQDLVGQLDGNGRLIKAGKFPGLINYPQAPEIFAEQAEIRLKAKEAEKVPVLLKEIKELKQKIGNITSPETGGRSTGSRKIDTDKQELEDIANEIRELQGQL